MERELPASDSGEWRWLWKAVRPLVPYQIAALLFTIAFGTLGLVSPLVVKWLIDEALPRRDWRGLGIATLVIFGAFALRTLMSATADYIKTLGAERLVWRLRLRLFKRLQRLPASYHIRQPVGELVQRVERDAGFVGELGSDIASSMARMVVEIALTTTALIVLDWRLALTVVPLLPIFVLVRYRYRARLQQAAGQVREAFGRQSSLLTEALTGAVQIQLLGAEPRFARRYARLGQETMARLLHQRRYELTFTFLSSCVIALGVALVIGYGGVRVITNTLTVGSLVAFYAYVGNIFTPLNTAVELYSRLNRVKASVRRLMDIEEVRDELRDVPGATPLTASPRTLSCSNLSFAYGPDASPLRGVGFQLRAGERVALVGESGCGKTSLLKLLPRLYNPTGGSLRIDDCDVRGVSLRSLRRAISFVPQDAMLFHGTLADNLRHANPLATPREIDDAARIADLTSLVERLPEGWDTMLGSMGAGLSGGERQRLAIARALIQGRPFLILDEATSALDPATEDRLLKGLHAWADGRLIVVVSHRLAVARWADRVIVLHRGEIVEEGPHERLYRPGTHYHALWQRTQTPETLKA